MGKAGAVVFAAALAAIAAAHAEPVVVEVSIEKYSFVPAEVRIKPGTTVRWTNNEKRASHSVWFKAEGLPESERMFPGETWQRSFDSPGSYPYTCGPHPEMNAVVIVE